MEDFNLEEDLEILEIIFETIFEIMIEIIIIIDQIEEEEGVLEGE